MSVVTQVKTNPIMPNEAIVKNSSLVYDELLFITCTDVNVHVLCVQIKTM
jgi:hypothetical protein